MNKLVLLIALMLVSVSVFAAQPQPAPQFISISDTEEMIDPVQPTQNQVADMNAPTSGTDCGCNEVTVKPDDIHIYGCIETETVLENGVKVKTKTCIDVTIPAPVEISIDISASM